MKAKFVILLLLVVLFTIFIIQNSQQITVQTFFWQFTCPFSLLMVIIAVVGIILGLIIAAIFDSKKKEPEITEDKTANQINNPKPNVE